MNQELKNKIKLISEMMSIYQTTVVNETDFENIKLIKKDITNKKKELEDAKKELNNELNQLYDNGANEIDPEINQMQILINDVDNLLEDIIPDILTYVNLPKFDVKPYNMFESIIEKENTKKIKVEVAPIEKVESNINKIDPIKNDQELNFIKVEDISAESIMSEIDDKPKIEFKFETNEKEKNKFEVIQKVDNIDKNQNKSIKITENIQELSKSILDDNINKKIIKKDDKVEENNIQKEDINQNDIKNDVSKIPSFINTIKLKQPTQDYRDTASSIISNRIKNVNSPENAVKKTYNAAEVVMNNIIEKWKENQ